MTLREFYEYNVRRRREEYNHREYKPGYNVEMGYEYYGYAARIRSRYMRLDWRLREIGDISPMSRPLTADEWVDWAIMTMNN